MLFTVDDLHTGRQLFSNKVVLGRALSRYRPAFLSVPLEQKKFGELITAFPDYRLVWFDDAEALYVDRTQQPSLASQYALEGLDPYTLVTEEEWKKFVKNPERAPWMRQLARLLEIDPDCQITNTLVASVYNAEGSYDRSIVFATAIVRNFPEAAIGYSLLGDAWKGLRAFDRAMSYYHQALRRAGEDDKQAIQKQIGAIYREEGRYDKAFRVLSGSLDRFSETTPLEDLFELATVARLAGRTTEAVDLLKYLSEFRVASDQVQWQEKLETEWALLRQRPKDTGARQAPTGQ